MISTQFITIAQYAHNVILMSMRRRSNVVDVRCIDVETTIVKEVVTLCMPGFSLFLDLDNQRVECYTREHWLQSSKEPF